jgi:hypothetical protein
MACLLTNDKIIYQDLGKIQQNTFYFALKDKKNIIYPSKQNFQLSNSVIKQNLALQNKIQIKSFSY